MFQKADRFGVGNLMPRVAFFGEAPGAEEDKTGEPFVGPAGQLLTKIIEATTMRRERRLHSEFFAMSASDESNTDRY